ncbi:hypothetical protein EX895_005595 [Sporisorium graminicola]|uniref:J domain-containing protein n=1 Tax=Sporisorium graminicola TaxID=280036 RepID=A0A4U7KMV7_9BASI|nr:hypothetical protein EX895_005595 [Sporisorium graminicola]TKY85433.1 hypothetical protein EX895_005595 [Sporisorium graminicola]
MPPPARATVEEIDDDDDPYAPYRAGRGGSSGSRPSSGGSRSSSSSASSSSSSSANTSSSSRTSASSGTNMRNRETPASYGQNSTASDIYDQSPSAGTQGTFPREGGDEEPLFGGRPFRDSHDPPSSSDPSADPASRATDKEYLYAILNVPTDASPDAIKDAYRSLAVVLHPDKHNDASRKSAAESRFREVQRAYEILSDAEKRTIYDYFGEEGLKSTWSVAVRGRNPAEMQAEFERERRRKQAADAEALVKSKGDFTAHVDASALFAHPSRIARRPLQQQPPFGAQQKPSPAAAVAAAKDTPTAVPGGMVAPTPSFARTSISLADRIASINCTQLIGKHGFETQVTNQTSATFSGQMVSRNGLGGGNLVGTVKTHWSPRLFSEITLSFLRPQIITTKGQYTLDANSFFTWQSTLQTPLLPPTLNVTYGQRLSTKSTLTGFTSVRSGTYSIAGWGRDVGGGAGGMVRREPAAVSVGLTKQVDEGKGWTVQTSVSAVDQNVSFDYALKVLSGVKVRTGFNLGTGSGVSAFASAERRLTENTRVSLGLNCALPVGGVTLRIKLNRLGQKILLPILLSPEFRSDLVVAFTVLPAAAYTALHWGYLEPRKHARLRDRLGELRRANHELIAERRAAAVEAREVLRDQAVKKARVEVERSGLVILAAWYGRKDELPLSALLSSRPSSADLDAEAKSVWSSIAHQPPATTAEAAQTESPVWDVMIPLQALTTKGQLIVPAGRSKANLLGFHDPVMGERKHLSVVYTFRGALHHVVVADWDELALPMRIHQWQPATPSPTATFLIPASSSIAIHPFQVIGNRIHEHFPLDPAGRSLAPTPQPDELQRDQIADLS